MKIQDSRFKIQSFKVICLLFFLTTMYFLFNIQPLAIASEKWTGIDETVIEKYAKDYGRDVKEPFINTDQGDLLLFVFLIAGAISGFIAGYFWKTLTLGVIDKNRD